MFKDDPVVTKAIDDVPLFGEYAKILWRSFGIEFAQILFPPHIYSVVMYIYLSLQRRKLTSCTNLKASFSPAAVDAP